MHALPVDDFFAKGRVREDGRLLHDFFLAEVKAPSESIAPWDYYKIRRHPGAGGGPAARAIEMRAHRRSFPTEAARGGGVRA